MCSSFAFAFVVGDFTLQSQLMSDNKIQKAKDLHISVHDIVHHIFILKLQVEFEDKIITDRAAWVATGVSPFGQAPLLEVDGKPIAQTGAIARYCGKLSGHYPKVIGF